MADAEILALLDHIKDVGERVERKLDDHIQRDENVNQNFVLPLWNAYQRRQGATAVSIAFYTVLSGATATLVAWWHAK